MGSLDRSVVYTYEIRSNISQISREITETTTQADGTVKELITKENELNVAASQVTASFTKQEAQLIKQITAIGAVQSAVSGVTNGLIQMGLVTGENADRLRLLNAGMQTFTGFANGIKALTLIYESFNLATLKQAILGTFNKILESPWKMAAVGIGLGAAAGVAAAYGAQDTSAASNSNTNIIINGSGSGALNMGNTVNATISGGRII